MRESPATRGKRPLLDAPALTLVVALLLTLVSTLAAAYLGRERDRMRFENAVQGTTDRVRSRLDAHVAMLYGARSLFAAGRQVSARQFRTYVRELEVEHRYPGMQGIGYSKQLTPEEFVRLGDGALGAVLGAGEDRVILDVPPQFRTWPQYPRSEHHAIVLLEPPTQRNAAALGFDMFSDSTRREAMARARETGEPALTRSVKLIQELDDENWQPGFLIYLPLYAVAGDTTAPREFLGFVYAPFRAHQLLDGIFGSELEPHVDFAIYDGDRIAPGTLLYDSNPGERGAARFTSEREFSYAGHRWTIAFRSRPVLGVAATYGPVLALLLLGLGLSWLLYTRSRAEQDARAAMEHSDAMRSCFFASMSHELRTPLNAIIGYTELLLHGIGGSLAPTQQDYLERSRRAARHLQELVNDVLDLSRLENGKLEVMVEELDVVAVIEELFATTIVLAQSRGTTLHLEAASGTPLIRTDPRRLRQILLNLISNAIKFGRRQPVVVRCRRSREGGVVVEVHDRGGGIAPADQERVFQEFVQISTDQTDEGTGLGLPISKRLATLLGASLELDSVPGHGSVFRLTLPPTIRAVDADA